MSKVSVNFKNSKDVELKLKRLYGPILYRE